MRVNLPNQTYLQSHPSGATTIKKPDLPFLSKWYVGYKGENTWF